MSEGGDKIFRLPKIPAKIGNTEADAEAVEARAGIKKVIEVLNELLEAGTSRPDEREHWPELLSLKNTAEFFAGELEKGELTHQMRIDLPVFYLRLASNPLVTTDKPERIAHKSEQPK